MKCRLEDALSHLLTLQSPEGAFSEYGWQSYKMPGTTFAIQFLGQTVHLLEEAKAADSSFPCIREDLYGNVVAAYRKALTFVRLDKRMAVLLRGELMMRIAYDGDAVAKLMPKNSGPGRYQMQMQTLETCGFLKYAFQLQLCSR